MRPRASGERPLRYRWQRHTKGARTHGCAGARVLSRAMAWMVSGAQRLPLWEDSAPSFSCRALLGALDRNTRNLVVTLPGAYALYPLGRSEAGRGRGRRERRREERHHVMHTCLHTTLVSLWCLLTVVGCAGQPPPAVVPPPQSTSPQALSGAVDAYITDVRRLIADMDKVDEAWDSLPDVRGLKTVLSFTKPCVSLMDSLSRR